MKIKKLETIQKRLKEDKPVWLLMPAKFVGQLPVGLVLELAQKGLILKPCKEELDEYYKKG